MKTSKYLVLHFKDNKIFPLIKADAILFYGEDVADINENKEKKMSLWLGKVN